jgi:hypothetical protein
MSLAVYFSRVRSSEMLDRNTWDALSAIAIVAITQYCLRDKAFAAFLTEVALHKLLKRRSLQMLGQDIASAEIRTVLPARILAWRWHPSFVNEQKLRTKRVRLAA